MTGPALPNVPNVSSVQMCRLRWTILDYDGEPADVSDVTFTSSVPYTVVAGQPVTLVSLFPYATFVNGSMHNEDGDAWVDIIASEDMDMDPHHWTITATVTVGATASRGRYHLRAVFTTPVNGDINLSTSVPVTESSGTALFRGPSGTGITSITAVGTTATVTYDDGSTSTFTLPSGTANDANVATYVSTPGTDTNDAIDTLIGTAISTQHTADDGDYVATDDSRLADDRHALAVVVAATGVSGTYTPDAAALPGTGGTIRLSLTGNVTLATPTSPTDGQTFTVELIQDATGGRTLTLSSGYAATADVVAPVLTTAPNKRDYIVVKYDTTATKWHLMAVNKGA